MTVNMLRFSVTSWSSLSYLPATGLQFSKLGGFHAVFFSFSSLLRVTEATISLYQGIGGVNATLLSPGFNRN
jgi:hypothetical protein